MLSAIALLAVSALIDVQAGSSACAVTPTQAPLPHIVGDVRGAEPVWMSTGDGYQPNGFKTLWVFKTRLPVHVRGHEITTGAITRFQRGGLDGPITTEMVVDNPRRETVIPGGADRDLL